MGYTKFPGEHFEKTAVFSAQTLASDRTSVIVNKTGRNMVSIDARLVMGGAGPFDASGVLQVLAGDNAGLVEADSLALPQATVSVAGTIKMELETSYPYIALFYNRTGGGTDDTITASISVS